MNIEQSKILRTLMQKIGDIVERCKKVNFEIHEFEINDLYEVLNKTDTVLARFVKINGHGMRFEDILPSLREGKEVRRKEMIGFGYVCKDIYNNTILIRDIRNDMFREYSMTSRDILAEDWEVLHKKVKKYPALLITREGRKKPSESTYYDLNEAIEDYKDTPYKVERLLTEVPELVEEVQE